MPVKRSLLFEKFKVDDRVDLTNEFIENNASTQQWSREVAINKNKLTMQSYASRRTDCKWQWFSTVVNLMTAINQTANYILYVKQYYEDNIIFNAQLIFRNTYPLHFHVELNIYLRQRSQY